ncbi:hypothetical protein BLNAU_14403 [Blattamonas nauphoetae]|uniref:Uncharacterized protein n=1 Tax=Blattamonas nauphoetae TaxID=2049346 RepID=A0ABQ9XHC3_9EUKA|nr:hypothetical protein BLNAU_14403 [Blattamonas nauphoetae]
MMILLSSASQIITIATTKMLKTLILWCSAKSLLALVNADLIPQLIKNLNPLSFSFTEAEDIHINIMKSIRNSLWLAAANGLEFLEIKDGDEQQAVYETVFKQVLVPSEKYLCQFCVNRFSIVDGKQSENFLELIPQLLRICPYYQPTMEFILHMPVFITIPSCLTFFENCESMINFLNDMNYIQQEWNMEGGEVRQGWKTVLRMLRMEGFEDVIGEKLQNDTTKFYGRSIVDESIECNNELGMNLPRLW